MSQTKFDSVDLSRLPALQNIDASQIKAGMNSLTTGAKGWSGVFKLAAVGALAYGVWKYILPTLFVAVGQALAVVAGLAILTGAFIMRKPFVRWMENAARAIDKKLIKENPWLVFEKQKRKFVEAIQKFSDAYTKMRSLAHDTKKKAEESAEQAKAYQEAFQSLKKQADELKLKMEQAKGVDANAYTQYYNDSAKAAAKAHSAMLRYNQAKDLSAKYAARGSVMDNLVRKLSTGSTFIEIKKLEFDNTVEMLKIDYNFFKESAEATGQMSSAMNFQEEWQVEYAIEATKAVTASYISATQMNLNDIENLTANYNIDNEAIFAKLDVLTQKIETGEEKVIDVTQYQNPDYVLTAKDRSNAGFGSDMF